MRAVIADDSILLRAGVAKVLTFGGWEVIAEVGEPSALVDVVEEFSPDLAVVDVRMPPTLTDEGVRAALTIKERRPDTGVLLLSQWVEEHHARELFAEHPTGVGYLLKERVSDIDDFLDAVQRVAAGGTVLDPEVVSQLLARRPDSPLARLSPRERDVLELVAEGRSNSAIAESLFLSESAVSKHINAIFTKLDLSASNANHRRVLAVLQLLRYAGTP